MALGARFALWLAAAVGLALFPGWGPAAKSELARAMLGEARLQKLTWADLRGWADDDQAAALRAFAASCRAIARARPDGARPMEEALRRVCAHVPEGRLANAQARQFFQTHFAPVGVTARGAEAGFLTGYYEPVVEGARARTAEYTVPLYRRPPDLKPRSGRAPKEAPLEGDAVWWPPGSHRGPYHDRAAIEDGALAGRGLEIAWLRDPIDAFFAQIQGSARVRLPEGATLRLNYEAQNGWPYTAVGAFLVERGIVPKDEMSMDRIRQWMAANPVEGRELRRRNRSYVFFRAAALGAHEEAVGAQGVPLAAGRSVAVDSKLHAYGTPFWIEAELPLADDDLRSFHRLMIAQDTGSAILGPARADIYFGSGPGAARVAGRVRHPGRFVMLVPRGLDLAVLGTAASGTEP